MAPGTGCQLKEMVLLVTVAIETTGVASGAAGTCLVFIHWLGAIAIAFAPIYFANLLFTSRFKDAANPTAAFAANLFGAMVGGCLEYLSLVLGYR